MAIRKSVTRLTEAEKAQYVDGVKLMKAAPPPAGETEAGNLYDFYVVTHRRSMDNETPPGNPRGRNAAHRGPAFLPWHREFILRYERDLQTLLGDNDFGLPYWDWAADAALSSPTDPEQAAVWRNNFMGGEGNPVSRGPFVASEWTTVPPQAGSTQTSLVRCFGCELPNLPPQDSVNTALRLDVYDSDPWNTTSSPSFRNFLEGWSNPSMLHNLVHRWVGGSMLPGTSPNDPVFFLHHCNVDRLWALWQTCHPTVPYAPADSVTTAPLGHKFSDPMFPWNTGSDIRRPRDLLDINALGFSYEDFSRRYIRLERTTGNRFVSSQIIQVGNRCDTRDDISTTVFLPAASGGEIRAKFDRTQSGPAAGDVTVIETVTEEISIS